MKTILLAFLSLAASGLAQNNVGFLTKVPADSVPDSRPSVSIGSFWWQGSAFKDAVATLVNSGSVRIAEKNPVPSQSLARGGTRAGSARSVSLTWEKTPLNIRAKLAAEREKMVALETEKASRRADDAALAAAGFELVGGKILNRLSTGFLVSDEQNDLIVHIVGKTDKADGESWSARVRRDGLYEYTSVLGARSTVKNYVQP